MPIRRFNTNFNSMFFKTTGVSVSGLMEIEAIPKFGLPKNEFWISTIFLFIIGQIEGHVEKKNSIIYTFPI